MNKVPCLAGLLVLAGLGLCGPSGAGEPCCSCKGWPCWDLRRPCPCCPNDYCPKKLPPVPCRVKCCCPDDYCPKRLPIPCPLKYCGPDDYCCKPCPPVPLPCAPPWFTCGPATVLWYAFCS